MDRKKESARAIALIKSAAKGDGDAQLVDMVGKTRDSRKAFDKLRTTCENEMEMLAMQLPVYQWVKTVNGYSAIGLATTLALTGDLSNYANVGKVWKRLMLAPYDGHAGSTWKREIWRPRALTKEEWIANPFSGERYAMIFQYMEPLHKKQVLGKKKAPPLFPFGKPKGPYGAIFVSRREKKADCGWPLQQAYHDALRIMFKALIRDLWVEWQRCANPKFVNKPWRPDDKPWRPELIAAE